MNGDLGAKVSRRSILLHGAICATGVATLLVANINAAKAAKMPQKAVAYQPTPKGALKCSNCVLFESPNQCKSVVGPVSGEGWCLIYRKR